MISEFLSAAVRIAARKNTLYRVFEFCADTTVWWTGLELLYLYLFSGLLDLDLARDSTSISGSAGA